MAQTVRAGRARRQPASRRPREGASPPTRRPPSGCIGAISSSVSDLECFVFDRERLSDAYEDALALVADRRLLGGDLDGARRAADELLARDPLREEAHATLLRVYGRTGSRPQVLRQYRRLTELLDRELGVEPLPETTATFESALAETIERSRQRAASVAFGGRALPGEAPPTRRPDPGRRPALTVRCFMSAASCRVHGAAPQTPAEHDRPGFRLVRGRLSS